MGKTIIEKIIENHSGQAVVPGAIVDVKIDVRVARDFGGANVVKNLQDNGLRVDDPKRTFFTFDCNPGGSDQKYASNQHLCRIFARENGIRVFDLPDGIGTHLVIERGIVAPGDTFISTDSHANILGAVGAFGQGMGDQDIAAAWSRGSVWFKVPPTIKIILKGMPGPLASAKDLALAILRETGANGLLGFATEFYGQVVDSLDLAERITIASMNTEMGGIIALFPPNQSVLDYFYSKNKRVSGVFADPDAEYARVWEIDVAGLEPQISKPGHPEDVVPVSSVAGKPIDSAFVGSCTNGRFEDLQAIAKILKGRTVAPGVVFKIVPATDQVWQRCLKDGLFNILKKAGALIGNAGCAGCANGQIGQNGPGEVTISSGNRNFAGKQGKGDVWLASPATVAASAVAGYICSENKIPAVGKKSVMRAKPTKLMAKKIRKTAPAAPKPTVVSGRVWVVAYDNIDTDMIFHNRYLAITDLPQMGQYTFDNLKGWEDFAKQAKPGDIIITGKNFGAGSSRQQAVDCFISLGISVLLAESFGAIYERNAINAGLPIMVADLVNLGIEQGEAIQIDFVSGQIIRLRTGDVLQGQPFAPIQMQIYQRGGLLV
jgi:3-isopropylmalate dehydratase small subunit